MQRSRYERCRFELAQAWAKHGSPLPANAASHAGHNNGEGPPHATGSATLPPMFAFPRAQAVTRFSIGTFALLALSILLHFVAVRTVATLNPPLGADRDQARAAPFVVHLHAPAPKPPATARPVPPPKKPPRKPPRKVRPKAPQTQAPALPTWQMPSPPSTQPFEALDPETATDPEFVENRFVENGRAGLAADETTEPAQVPGGAQADPAPIAQSPATPEDPSTTKITYRTEPPPPAELRYAVHAVRQDGEYFGKGTIKFMRQEGGYTIIGATNLLFISVLDFRSDGLVTELGLEPLMYTEKRFRRAATNTHFQHENKLISFSASARTYPRAGGEQDRASIVWQLAAIGRGEPAQLRAGQEITLFVAGVREAEPWIIQVIGEETVEADGRPVPAIHLVRYPRPGSYEQKLDIWLAPTMQWYPVKLRFTEANKDRLDMSLADPPLPAPRP